MRWVGTYLARHRQGAGEVRGWVPIRRLPNLHRGRRSLINEEDTVAGHQHRVLAGIWTVIVFNIGSLGPIPFVLWPTFIAWAASSTWAELRKAW